jgi:formylglycine-generating enzyme required for sulfatase activity
MGSPNGCPGPAGYPGDCEEEPGRSFDESPLHRVTLTRPFFLGTTPVTQAQWFGLMGNRPWSASAFDCDDCPAGFIGWWSALSYANALSEREGLPECYALTGCTGDPGDGLLCTGVEVNASGGTPYLCEGYRLAMEAEWEYAYRAGTTTAFYSGPIADTSIWECGDDDNLDAIAWYCGNGDGWLQPVGQKEPNAWGLYDMAGNLWEAVWDVWARYPAEPTTDPQGPASGRQRVLRGGAHDEPANLCRAAVRVPFEPERFGDGFRIARSAP